MPRMYQNLEDLHFLFYSFLALEWRTRATCVFMPTDAVEWRQHPTCVPCKSRGKTEQQPKTTNEATNTKRQKNDLVQKMV
jgi:hypothetical protein